MARNKTVLEVISQAAMEIGITQQGVSSVVSINDQDIIQLRTLLTTVADEVMMDEPYRDALSDGLWLYDVNAEPKDVVTADTDVIAFDARLAINGLKWRFLKAKGLEFGEELRDFSIRMNKLSGALNGRVLDLDTDESRVI